MPKLSKNQSSLIRIKFNTAIKKFRPGFSMCDPQSNIIPGILHKWINSISHPIRKKKRKEKKDPKQKERQRKVTLKSDLGLIHPHYN